MTAPTRSGFTAKRIGVYPRRNHVQFQSLVSEYARRTGCRWNTAKAKLSLSHQSNPVSQAAGIVAFLRDLGAFELADAFVRHVAEAGLPRPTPILTVELIQDHAHWDNRDDEALIAFLSSDMECPAAADTLAKALGKSIPLATELKRAVAAHHAGLVARRETQK